MTVVVTWGHLEPLITTRWYGIDLKIKIDSWYPQDQCWLKMLVKAQQSVNSSGIWTHNLNRTWVLEGRRSNQLSHLLLQVEWLER